MSIEDLKAAVGKSEKPLPPLPIATSHEQLAEKGRGVQGIVAHREVETDFFSDHPNYNYVVDPTDPFPNLPPQEPQGPSIIEQLKEDPLAKQIYRTSAENMKPIMFAADYSSRLIRSAMALTGLSARTQRFGEIRETRGFWPAVLDATAIQARLTSGRPVPTEVTATQIEQTKKIPKLLTDIDTPTTDLPGIEDVATAINAPGPDWLYGVVGEVLIERKATGAIKKLASSGMSKLTKATYEAGEDIAKKKVASNLLGNLTDDEMVAIAEARRAAKRGLLGTRPPQGQIDDAVKRTFKYIEDTGEARLTKEQIIKTKRRAGAARMYDVQGEGYGRGYSQRLRKAGAISKTDPSFTPFLDATESASGDYVTLQKTIDNFDFSGSKIYTTTNAQESLAKLYEYGELLTPGEVDNLRMVFGDSFADSLRKFTSMPKGLSGKAIVAGHNSLKGMNATARTLMTTGELSYLLRQGNYRAWTRPKDALKSFIVASRALFSKKYAGLWDEAIRGSARGKRAIESGVWFGKFGDDIGLSAREEFFTSEWLHKVPFLKRGVAAFERGYTLGLNQIRLDWFDEGAEIVARQGGGEKPLKLWADYVNNMTGRADLDALILKGRGAEADKIMKRMVETAESVMFAPRFAASKVNRNIVAAKVVFGNDAPTAMRRLIVTDTISKWRAYERLAHYAEQNGYTVELDPTSSDFLKIRRGNTRYDMLGGGMQEIVLLARIASGQTKDTETGELRDAAAGRLIAQYASGKLNPAMSTVVDMWVEQRTFEGKDMNDPKVLASEFAKKFIPLYIQDISDKIFDGYEKEGWSLADQLDGELGTVALVGFTGGGIQTFQPSPRKKIEMLYNDSAQRLFGEDYWNLSVEQKQDAKFEAEIDYYDELFQLKQEAGMIQMAPGTAAVIKEDQNKSERRIRGMLGNSYKLFRDSNVNPGFISKDQQDIRLNKKQLERLEQLYVTEINSELRLAPYLRNEPAKSEIRVQDLEDILSIAKENAIELLIEEESK